ncbi:MAG: DUF5615 family PIN-like protein [Gammaproteobacteria bacterium]|nr:DUF5615 family PIN-like protein [Gammaproteobacteria bacterium]
MEKRGLSHGGSKTGLGAPDHSVLARCIKQNLVLVTQNARDFRSTPLIVPISHLATRACPARSGSHPAKSRSR